MAREKSFFVFMDILGFKEIVEKGNLSEIYDILHERIRTIKNNTSGTILHASDSIFFKCTKFNDVITFIKVMYDGCIIDLLDEDRKRIPFLIRGAISYGEVSEAYPAGGLHYTYEHYTEPDSINALNLLGKPIIDAYELSETKGMKGARLAIHESILRKSVLSKNEINDFKNYFRTRTNPDGIEYTEFLWPAFSHENDETVDFLELISSVWNIYNSMDKKNDPSKNHYLSTIALILKSFENNREMHEELMNFLNSSIDAKEKRNFIIKEINFLKERDFMPEIKEYYSLLHKYPQLKGRESDPLKIKTSLNDIQDYTKKKKIGVLLKTPYTIVIRDLVENIKGDLFDYERIINPNVLDGYEGVVIIPVLKTNEEKRVLFIENFRHALRSTEIELPRGFGEIGKSTLDTAKNELEQEVGCKADKWEMLGRVYSDTGITNNIASVFYAEVDLSICKQNPEKTEAISEKYIIASKNEIMRLIHRGEIKCGFTLSALMLLISKNKL